MSVEYKDFCEVAGFLLNVEPCTEVLLRSCMSRAYYGFYHAALNYADTIATPTVSSMSGPTHAKLSAYYQLPVQGDKQAKLLMRQVGYSLKQLHELRCKADYELETTIDQLEADACYQRCLSKILIVEQLMAQCAA